MQDRIRLGTLEDVIRPLDLLGLQLNSYRDFLQQEIPADQRQKIGLEAALQEVFPIESYDGKYAIEYVSYTLKQPQYSDVECMRCGITYAVALWVQFCLKRDGDSQYHEVYMGEIPLMTSRASFIINGVERVVIPQLHRAPGLAFAQESLPLGKRLSTFRIIPEHGTWIEVQCNANDVLHVSFNRKGRKNQLLITTFLRAFGLHGDLDIIKLFYKPKSLSVEALLKRNHLDHLFLLENVMDVSNGMILARAFDPLNKIVLKTFSEANIQHVSVIDASVDDGIILQCLKKDTTATPDEALRAIFNALHPGESDDLQSVRLAFQRLLCDEKLYDLGRIGRYRMNQKLGLSIPLSCRLLTLKDIVAAVQYVCRLHKQQEAADDIDFLGNRCVRLVGELAYHQCRLGLLRMQRLIRQNMMLPDQMLKSESPWRLLNMQKMSNELNDFFVRSQMSQLMDQINPLGELTHKRRLSSLGVGGLSREHAALEVRDVHPSYYGRICPIETPEGSNIGLINSLSVYARVNDFGFIETPYRKVREGVVTDEVHYLTADQERNEVVAQIGASMDKNGKLTGPVVVRRQFEIGVAEPKEVTFMEISSKQTISLATSLVPFLEHNDASRALMAANMQRQAVPLLACEAPLVGTGMEGLVALDSRDVVVSKSDGKVAAVDGQHIVVTSDGQLPSSELVTDESQGIYVYPLRNFMRSNAATCYHQRPSVALGETVKKGQCLSDGAAIKDGELALGKNIVVAYMPWYGYNYEDAIVLSDRLVLNDAFTSVHIETYEVIAEDTKLGAEEITRDIPNVGEGVLKKLDARGIVYIGSEVYPGDILVGKITPRGEVELAPEERLLRAIFGDKATGVKNSSLTVPSGTSGVVVDVQVFSNNAERNGADEKSKDYNRQAQKLLDAQNKANDELRQEMVKVLASILLGEKIPLDITDAASGAVVIPANRKITKTLLRRLVMVSDSIQMDPAPIREKIWGIIKQFRQQFDELRLKYDEKRKMLDEPVNNAIIKRVKVSLAVKRKIQVGDKMAGRYGNKGVVACVVPVQDMPFLEDGTPVDMILNPLGVPSRMNIGQILETHLAWACKALGIKVAIPVFSKGSVDIVKEFLNKAQLPSSGKMTLYNGYTGDPYREQVTVGVAYMMKLNHQVADKIHARAVGPYSLITQQPLGGKAHCGGQRLGEMEVWALEAYGVAHLLKELLTVKSDDVQGRTRMYEMIVRGMRALKTGMPESFHVLIKELQALGFDVELS